MSNPRWYEPEHVRFSILPISGKWEYRDDESSSKHISRFPEQIQQMPRSNSAFRNV